jgi:hypothetical protein
MLRVSDPQCASMNYTKFDKGVTGKVGTSQNSIVNPPTGMVENWDTRSTFPYLSRE